MAAYAFNFVTNAGNIAARFRTRANKLIPELLIAEKQNMDQMKKVAIKYSSATAYSGKMGTIKPAPYGRRGGSPPLAPYWVNIQEGIFVRHWKTTTTVNLNGFVSTIYNDARNDQGKSYSGYINIAGTYLMIGRPILNKVIEEVRPERIIRLSQALKNAMNVNQ